MADSDYICVYRQFFEEFAKSHELEDYRPMRVNFYNVAIDELIGEVLQFCVNFLMDRRCPKGLVVPLTKIVVEELLSEAKKQPDEVNTPLKLNKKTLDKISEVCLRYIDNEKLSSLPKPVQEVQYSTHSTKHIRRRMEDRLTCLPRFNSLYGIQSNSEAGYYGIFDGHGGINAACFAVTHLHQFLAESEYYPEDVVKAFIQAYEKTESRLNFKDEDSGTTALTVLHQPTERKLIVSWVGDSQAMLTTQDSYIMIVDPHKPERKDEKKRIEDLGGYIVQSNNVYRVNGGLAISRAIGDKKLKPYVNADPEFRVINLTGSEHFIVLGSDGLWDVVKPHEVIETVYFEVKKNEGRVDTVARRLVDLAKENFSTDNISVIVVFLTDPLEITNNSVDGTGHRPKTLLQDGVIMEANFQTNEKSLNQPGMNGIHETNGNHFGDNIKNESDEDFGPETDVDAVDDILTSSKNPNPFAADNWQEKQDISGIFDNMIMENMVIGGKDFINSYKDFPNSINSDDVMTNIFKNESVETGHEMFKDDLMSVVHKNESGCISVEAATDLKVETRQNELSQNDMNPLDVLSPCSNGSTDINFTKDEFDLEKGDLNSQRSQADQFRLGSPVDIQVEKMELENIDLHKNFNENFKGVGLIDTDDIHNKVSIIEEPSKDIIVEDGGSNSIEEPLNKSSLNSNPFGTNDNQENYSVTSLGDESQTSIERVPEPKKLLLTGETVDNNDLEKQVSSKANVETLSSTEVSDLLSKDLPPETEKHLSDFSPKEDNLSRNDVKHSPETHKAVTSALDEEAKDEIVAESGGEVEESEDDEWNYFKGGSGVGVSSNIQPSESVVTGDEDKKEKAMMNSPLNPDAAEFIPVSPIASGEEFLTNTPMKNIPHDLSDIVAASPDWKHMENISVPEESVFLKDIKSRPSNIHEKIEDSKVENNKNVLNTEIVEVDKNTDLETCQQIDAVGYKEPIKSASQGVLLASNMTSSFIDPSTMSVSDNVGNDNINFIKAECPSEIFSSAKSELMPLENDIDSMDAEVITLKPTQSTATSDGFKSPDLVTAKSQLSEIVSPEESHLPPPFSEAQPMSTESQNINLYTTSQSPLAKETEDAIKSIELSEKSEGLKEVFSNVAAEVVGADLVAGVAASKKMEKKDEKKASLKSTPDKISMGTKTSTTSKNLTNATKASPAPKKATPIFKTIPATKTSAGTNRVTSPSKTTASRTSNATKTVTKPSSPAASIVSKAPARPKTVANPMTISKTNAPKTNVSSTVKSASQTVTSKTAPKSTGVTTAMSTLKPKPRVSSAPNEKNQLTNITGKTITKRIESTITKKPMSNTTTITAANRVSLPNRPATAPAKPGVSRTMVTTTTTRTVTAKPRNMGATTTTTVNAPGRISSTVKKSTTGTDKQAKEVANRITSKSTIDAKTRGLTTGKSATNTLTKSKRTTESITKPSIMKADKTEIKAENLTIVEKTIEFVQSENGNVLSMDNNKDINLINSIASD